MRHLFERAVGLVVTVALLLCDELILRDVPDLTLRIGIIAILAIVVEGLDFS